MRINLHCCVDKFVTDWSQLLAIYTTASTVCWRITSTVDAPHFQYYCTLKLQGDHFIPPKNHDNLHQKRIFVLTMYCIEPWSITVAELRICSSLNVFQPHFTFNIKCSHEWMYWKYAVPETGSLSSVTFWKLNLNL